MKSKIYIDGENFVHEVLRVLIEEGYIKQRSDLRKFDVLFLLNQMFKEADLPASITYYTTKLRKVSEPDYLQKLSDNIANWNARWTPWLISQGLTIVKAGTLKKRDGHRCRNCGHTDQLLQEKGVDVRLATDLLFDAVTHEVDTIFMVSSDSDLIPAVLKARTCGARVTYIAQSERLNRAIVASVDETKVYDRQKIVEAYKRVNHE